MQARRRFAFLTIAAAPAGVLGQTSIDPSHKFCWQENGGWVNWYDAEGGASGARDAQTHLTGYLWCENNGWVCVGPPTGPANGIYYANVDSSDYGVNVAIDGTLTGFAWAENAGWVNFGGGALASPPQPALYDSKAGRFRGWVWWENMGWMNLDDATSYVAEACYANCDQSTTPPILNTGDFTCFLQKYVAGDPYANCDRSSRSPAINTFDFTCFLRMYANG